MDNPFGKASKYLKKKGSDIARLQRNMRAKRPEREKTPSPDDEVCADLPGGPVQLRDSWMGAMYWDPVKKEYVPDTRQRTMAPIDKESTALWETWSRKMNKHPVSGRKTFRKLVSDRENLDASYQFLEELIKGMNLNHRLYHKIMEVHRLLLESGESEEIRVEQVNAFLDFNVDYIKGLAAIKGIAEVAGDWEMKGWVKEYYEQLKEYERKVSGTLVKLNENGNQSSGYGGVTPNNGARQGSSASRSPSRSASRSPSRSASRGLNSSMSCASGNNKKVKKTRKRRRSITRSRRRKKRKLMTTRERRRSMTRSR